MEEINQGGVLGVFFVWFFFKGQTKALPFKMVLQVL